MLQGYEKENESLTHQNKQLRQAGRLRKEEVDSRQLQLVAELNAARASADINPASMKRVADLERELGIAKERAAELASELERSREDNRQLQRELLAGPQAPAAGAERNAKINEEAAASIRALEAELSDAKEKIRWYAEGQLGMDEDRKEVERLSEEIRQLRSKNEELSRRPGIKESNRRVEELRSQVEELQECLRKRNPDSILAMMKACEPRPEEKRLTRELQKRVDELEGKLGESAATHDRQ